MIKKLGCVLVCIGLIGFLDSCTQKKRKDFETLLFNLDTEPPTLDPSRSTDTTSGLVIQNLWDGLTDYDYPQTKIIPKVAKEWKISKNGLVYTFYLRDDVFWTDGKKVTAKDFEYAWFRLIDPATAAEYAYFLFDVKNAREFNEKKITDASKVGIRAVDEKTFQITLKKPVAYFLHVSTFAGLNPLRKDVIDQWKDQWTEPAHIITNGPFRLQSWQHDYELILARNENYYGKKAALKTIRCLMVNEQSTALSLYETGKLDIIRTLPPLEIPKLKQSKEFRSGNFLGTYYIGFSIKRTPLENVYVRRALASAIDRKQITDLLEKGDIPSASLLPMGVMGYNPNIGLEFNIQKAVSWMEQGGWILKEEGVTKQWIHKTTQKPFPPLTLMYNTNESHKTIMENLQAQWQKNLNIPILIENQEWKVYTDALHTAQKNPDKAGFHLFRLAWIADYPDPDNFMSLFTSYSDNNNTGWKNLKFDALTEQAKVSLSETKRAALYAQAQKILLEEDAAILPLYIYAHQAMWKPEVQGVALNILDVWPLDQIWLDKGTQK